MLPAVTKESRESEILARAIQPERHNLSVPAARALLRIQLDAEDRKRLHELLVKNQNEGLTSHEQEELNSYLHVGMVIDLLQAKARASLAARR
jgi:hypothetical protein